MLFPPCDGNTLTEKAGQKILFLNWTPPQFNGDDDQTKSRLKKQAQKFISSAMQYVTTYVKENLETIAFSINEWEKYPYKKQLVDEILNEMKRQLETRIGCRWRIQFIFVSCDELYKVFLRKILSLQTAQDGYVDFSIPTPIIQITLSTSKTNNLIKCRNTINNYIKKSVHITKKLDDAADLKMFDQHQINAFYKYCIENSVIPIIILTFGQQQLELSGPIRAVEETEQKYYIISEILKRKVLPAASELSKPLKPVTITDSFNIMISCGQPDQKFCQRLKDRLIDEGYLVCVSTTGNQTSLIDKSDLIIIYFTEDYSRNIEELKCAQSLGKKLLTVKSGKLSYSGKCNWLHSMRTLELSYELLSVGIDFELDEHNFDREYEKLLVIVLQHTKPGVIGQPATSQRFFMFLKLIEKERAQLQGYVDELISCIKRWQRLETNVLKQNVIPFTPTGDINDAIFSMPLNNKQPWCDFEEKSKWCDPPNDYFCHEPWLNGSWFTLEESFDYYRKVINKDTLRRLRRLEHHQLIIAADATLQSTVTETEEHPVFITKIKKEMIEEINKDENNSDLIQQCRIGNELKTKEEMQKLEKLDDLKRVWKKPKCYPEFIELKKRNIIEFQELCLRTTVALISNRGMRFGLQPISNISSFALNESQGLQLLAAICHELANINTLKLFDNPTIIDHELFIFIQHTFEMLLTKSNYLQYCKMTKVEEQCFYEISYLVAHLCLYRNESLTCFYTRGTIKHPNELKIIDDKHTADKIPRINHYKHIVPSTKVIASKLIEIDNQKDIVDNISHINHHQHTLVPLVKLVGGKLITLKTEVVASQPKYEISAPLPKEVEKPSLKYDKQSYQDIFITKRFLTKLAQTINDLAKNEYDAQHVIYKVVDRLLRLCSKLNDIDIDLLLDPIVRCLLSKYYLTVFDTVDLRQPLFDPKQLFFICECPDFIVQHGYKRQNKIAMELCKPMLKNTQLIFAKHLSIILEGDNIIDPPYNIWKRNNKSKEKGARMQALTCHIKLLNYFALTPSTKKEFYSDLLIDNISSILGTPALIDSVHRNHQLFHVDVGFVAYCVILLYNLAFDKELFKILKAKSVIDICKTLHTAKDDTIHFASQTLSTILQQTEIDQIKEPYPLTEGYLYFIENTIDEPNRIYHGVQLEGVLEDLESLDQP
ncbi:unnamed protein product [Didymodactylos carnosus]|uniref:Uncharacterized protein n=1 Tax=Didymodactylos carnosus TaxID=1234261 RepID=A0A815CDH1_9BILA|nr:unnamed protein product [Didymodactylos carnosus]CAF4078450.1 unnamed protein product [Didymodactylos carnosus]